METFKKLYPEDIAVTGLGKKKDKKVSKKAKSSQDKKSAAKRLTTDLAAECSENESHSDDKNDNHKQQKQSNKFRNLAMTKTISDPSKTSTNEATKKIGKSKGKINGIKQEHLPKNLDLLHMKRVSDRVLRNVESLSDFVFIR